MIKDSITFLMIFTFSLSFLSCTFCVLIGQKK
nr:MAG TPA: hypothetical protein [Caudoviricetes sp.]